MENWSLLVFRKDPDGEREFLPAALEILETPPSPAGRMIAGTIIAFVTSALLWACFSSVDIIATASGKVVPTGGTKLIQPLESGVVRTIAVRDGQRVKAGEVLVEIDATITKAEYDKLQRERIEAELEAARLKAALDLSSDSAVTFAPPEDVSEMQIARAKDLLCSQLAEIRAKLSSLDQQGAQQRGNLAAVQSTIIKLNETLPYLRKRADALDSLKDNGSKLEYFSAKQDLIEHEQELQVQEGRLKEAQAAVASLQSQRLQSEAEYKHKILYDQTQAEQKAADLAAQLIEASKKYNLQTLTSPVDGTVQQLALHTKGGVVTPAQVLMAVVPAGSQLEIEAEISNQDIGFVHTGLEAAIKIDTFNYTKYGLLHGRILWVSEDALVHDKAAEKAQEGKQAMGAENESSEPKGKELVYQARIALDQTQIQIDDRLVNLGPGMAVTAEIKTGSRRIIEYLLSPIRKHAHQSLRER